MRVAYRVVGGDSHTVVECFDNNGYSAEIVPVDAASGFVEVSVPDPVVSGKVLVYAYNAAGRTVMKTLVFEEGIFEKISDTYKVGGNAECINVEIKTNLDYTMTVTAEAQGWIYVGPATKSDVRTDILRKRTGHAADVHLIGIKPLRLDKYLMPVLICKFYYFIFNRRTITGACSLDHTGK